MHASSVFSFGLLSIAAFSVAVMAYLNRPLRVGLTDLCGTADRALFWRAFTNITLFVFPLFSCSITVRQIPPTRHGCGL